VQAITAFIVGLVFSIGLGIAGMTQPVKIIGFLDFFGTWDPSLLFVMMGAMVMYFMFYRVVRGTAPILTEYFQIPTRRQIDGRLVVGSAMFGVGWGIAGFCPGPALASIGNAANGALVFAASMIGGMYLFAAVERVRAARLVRQSAQPM
jgi:hypothetical protein